MSKKLILEIQIPDRPPLEHEVVFGAYPIGTDSDNKIIISDPDVGGRHAIMILRADGFWLEDLNSGTGTLIYP